MGSVRFFDKNGECQHALAQRIWQILTGYVVFKQDISNQGKGLIHDADLAELLGFDRQAAVTFEAALRDIHCFCEQNYLPHLNSVVVKREISLAGRAAIFSNLGHYLREQNRVKQFDWFKVQTPTVKIFKKYSLKNTEPEIAKFKVSVGGLPDNIAPSSSGLPCHR